MDSAIPRRQRGRTSLLFTAIWCLYFLLAGWAVFRILPFFAVLLAGAGIAIQSDSILFNLFFRSVWVIASAVTSLIVAVLIKHFAGLSDMHRRLIKRFLIVTMIVSVPFVAVTLAFTAITILSGPFQLIGKLPL